MFYKGAMLSALLIWEGKKMLEWKLQKKLESYKKEKESDSFRERQNSLDG